MRLLPLILSIALVACGFSTEANAQCWRYDMTCCRVCDLHVLYCSSCFEGITCCPYIQTNNTLPKRDPADWPTGYKVVGTTITTVQALCAGEYLTPNEACDDCIKTGVLFGYSHAVDNPPDYNCPPAT